MARTTIDEICKRLDVPADVFSGSTVLVLPENLNSVKAASELQDTDDGIMLAKFLKSRGMSCKTAYDVGLRPKIFDRRGIDIWLGVVWIVENVAAPTVAGLLAAYLTTKYQQSESNTVHLSLKIQDGERTSDVEYSGSMTPLLHMLAGMQQLKKPEDDERT